MLTPIGVGKTAITVRFVTSHFYDQYVPFICSHMPGLLLILWPWAARSTIKLRRLCKAVSWIGIYVC